MQRVVSNVMSTKVLKTQLLMCKLLSEKLNSIEGIRLTRFGLFGGMRINGRTDARSCIPVYSSYDKRHYTTTTVRYFAFSYFVSSGLVVFDRKTPVLFWLESFSF